MLIKEFRRLKEMGDPAFDPDFWMAQNALWSLEYLKLDCMPDSCCP